MIHRYTRPEIGSIWSDENKYRTWLTVETAVLQAREEAGQIPSGVTEKVRRLADFSPARIEQLEADLRHDVIAFITNIGEYIGQYSQHFHQGLTSYDVVDTALSLQIQQASAILLQGLNRLQDLIKDKARQFKTTPCIGRTHGVHAEPITFGLKFANFYSEINRDVARFKAAVEDIRYGKLSSAVGTYTMLDPATEARVMEILELKPDPISTQIIQRDRHAYYIAVIAVIGGTLERIALEIRHLSRTEIQETEEPFGKKQRGSSAMPHKKNPVVCENICGLARILRANAQAALENQALWHERDISHSSVERIIFPDCTILMDYMLDRMCYVIKGLQVYPENMERNLQLSGGIIFSQNVLNALLDAGMGRDEAYKLTQKCALQARDEIRHFREVLKETDEITKILSLEKIDDCFKVRLKYVDEIFSRLGLSN